MLDTSGPSDSELVLAAREGDEAAYGELYRRHVRAVRLAVSDNVDDRESRDDVVQEAFIRGLAALHQLRDPAKFRSWLLQIARHAAVDHRRTRRAQVIASIDDEKTPPAHLDRSGSGRDVRAPGPREPSSIGSGPTEPP